MFCLLMRPAFYFFQAQHFKRREVASNWDRYEGLNVSDSDEDEEVANRGADFRILLEATSKLFVYAYIMAANVN